MSTSTASMKQAAATPYKLARAGDDNYVKGRRDFLRYRELGVTEATAGKLRCQITEGQQGLTEPTGWHYHECDGQFIYMLRGWLDLEFAGGDVVRLEPGDSMLIPGGTAHNEIATAEDWALIEVSVPADMGTKVCDAP